MTELSSGQGLKVEHALDGKKLKKCDESITVIHGLTGVGARDTRVSKNVLNV